MSTASKIALRDALAAIVGPEHVLTDDESRERLSFDAVTAHRLGGRFELAAARVDAVARPADTAEVAALVSLASEHGIPVVPYGGGTGVMGAVVPVRGGIALDLRRMDRIVEVSREDRTARVQPGVYLADLDAAARDYGMMLGHDPWSVPIATVGGAISTDSVGYRASRYGSMGQQVRALEVVLGSGEVVRTRPIQRQSSGPMLKGLFAGAEGTMGVITEATIDLRALPEGPRVRVGGVRYVRAGLSRRCPVVRHRPRARADRSHRGAGDSGERRAMHPLPRFRGLPRAGGGAAHPCDGGGAGGGRPRPRPRPDPRVLGDAARRRGALARPHPPTAPDRALEGAAVALRRLPAHRDACLEGSRIQALLRRGRRPPRSGRARVRRLDAPGALLRVRARAS